MTEKYIDPNSIKLEQLREENGRYEQWMKDHPEVEITKENLRECGPEIAEFEGLVALFEVTHSLEKLLSITDLTPDEAPKDPIREPARVALIPIAQKLNILKNETNISSEKHMELKAKYKRVSNAVGIISNNKVDHTR